MHAARDYRRETVRIHWCLFRIFIGHFRLYDEVPFSEDAELKEKHANDLKKKSNSFVKRDLDARYRSESFRLVFTLHLQYFSQGEGKSELESGS